MNSKAAVDEVITDFHTSEGQRKRWFRGTKGKQPRPCRIPYLPEEHMAACKVYNYYVRVDHAKKSFTYTRSGFK
jgi:hypothetical protein